MLAMTFRDTVDRVRSAYAPSPRRNARRNITDNDSHLQFIYERKHDEIALAERGFQSFECIGAAAEVPCVREAAGCEGRRAFAGHFRRISPALPPWMPHRRDSLSNGMA
jgi:hypothetical protein